MQELVRVDQKLAEKVLEKIDKLVEESKGAITKAENGFMALAFLLVEAKRGAYWTIRNYKSEHEYIQNVFPQSRAQYYRLIRIGQNLQTYDRKWLENVGSSKAEDIVKLHVHFNGQLPAEWKEHAEKDDKNAFRRRVRDHLGAKDKADKKADPNQEDHFLTFRIFGDGIHTVNMALDLMAKSIGSDKGMGYCLELLCANFLSGVSDSGDGRVVGKNSYILQTVKSLVQQLDLNQENASELLVGIIAAGIEENNGTKAKG